MYEIEQTHKNTETRYDTLQRTSREEYNKKRREEYHRRVEQGICTQCGENEATFGRLCEKCIRIRSAKSANHKKVLTDEQKAKRKEYFAEYRRTHKEERSNYGKETTNFRKSNRICIKCGKEPAVKGRVSCVECLEKNRLEAQRRRENMTEEEKERAREIVRANYRKRVSRYKAQGMCAKCGIRKAVSGKTLCVPCANKERAWSIATYNRRYRRTDNAGLDRSEWASYGICYTCGKNPVVPGKKLCKECSERATKHLPKDKNYNEYWSKQNNLIFIKPQGAK